MAELTVLYWRDIPAQVVAKAGRKQARRELDPRFQAAIDRAAMRADMHGTDAYLEAWRRGPPEPCGEDLEAEVRALVECLEAALTPARLATLVKAGGSAEAAGGP